MGRGTPCPMPEDRRVAIHLQITTLKALGCDIYEIAKKMQDLWPGCTANHVRGVIAGLKSATLAGDGGHKQHGYSARVKRMGAPWRPGMPKPGGV